MVAGKKPAPNDLSDAVPLALLEGMASKPRGVLLHEGPLLGVFRVLSRHLVDQGLDLGSRDEAGANRNVVDHPADAENHGRERRRDNKPFQAKQKPVHRSEPRYRNVLFLYQEP